MSEKTFPLHQAVQYRDVYKLKRLLESGNFDVNQLNDKGEHLITLAAEMENNDEVFEILLDCEKLDPKVCDEKKNTVLHYLACSGKLELIKKLFHKFPSYDIDTENVDGETPLILAAKRNHCKIIEYLFQKGANIQKKNKKGLPAFHYAAYNEYSSAARTLLSLGASENYSDSYLLTMLINWEPDGINDLFLEQEKYPLHEAVYHRNMRKLKRLLEVGAFDLKTKDEKGRTVLLLASEQENNNAEILKLLFSQKNFDPIAMDNQGCTLFHNLSLRGKLDLIKELCNSFPQINLDIENVEGETPLLMAAKGNHQKIIEYLCKKGVDLNKKNKEGLTALHYLAMNGHLESVRTLMRLGAQISLKDNHGCTPLMLSSHWGFPDITEILRSGEIYPIHALVLNQNAKKLESLLNLGVFDVNEPNDQGFPPLVLLLDKRQINDDDKILHLLLQQENLNPLVGDRNGYNIFHRLAAEGKLNLLQKLYDRYPNVEVDIVNTWNETPLILAAKKNHADVIRYLFAKGANINHQNEKKFTALQYAANNDGLESLKVLIELGGDLNILDNYGCTPLMLASTWGYYDIVKFILDKVDKKYINMKNNIGETALFRAVYRKVPVIVELLLQYGADGTTGKGPRNPLSRACSNKDTETVHKLIKGGVDINYPGDYSYALYNCLLGNNYECAKMLVDAGVKINGKYPNYKTVEDLANTEMLRILKRK